MLIAPRLCLNKDFFDGSLLYSSNGNRIECLSRQADQQLHLRHSMEVFSSVDKFSVHGIVSAEENKLFFYGEYGWGMARDGRVEFVRRYNDWVFCLKLLEEEEDRQIAVLFGSNTLMLYDCASMDRGKAIRSIRLGHVVM